VGTSKPTIGHERYLSHPYKSLEGMVLQDFYGRNAGKQKKDNPENVKHSRMEWDDMQICLFHMLQKRRQCTFWENIYNWQDQECYCKMSQLAKKTTLL